MSNKSVVDPYLNVSKYAISLIIDTAFPKEILEPIIKAVYLEYENYKRKDLGKHMITEIPYKVFNNEIATPINASEIYTAIMRESIVKFVDKFKYYNVSYNSQLHQLFDGETWIYYLSSVMTIKNIDDNVYKSMGNCISYLNIDKNKSTTTVIFIDCNKYDERFVHLHEISHVFANLFMGYRILPNFSYQDDESITDFIAMMVLYNYYDVSKEELVEFFDKTADILIVEKFFASQEELDIYMTHTDRLIKKLYKIGE